MVAQLEPFVDFDPDYVRAQFAAAQDYYRQSGQDPRPWSFGEIYNSMTGVYGLGGRTVRTPGEYRRTDPITQRPTRKPLKDTHEYVHPSVRSRRELDGPGVQDRGSYDPPARLQAACHRRPPGRRQAPGHVGEPQQAQGPAAANPKREPAVGDGAEAAALQRPRLRLPARRAPPDSAAPPEPRRGRAARRRGGVKGGASSDLERCF